MTSIDIELAKQETRRPRCILNVDDSKRSLLRQVFLAIIPPQTINIAELLTNDFSPAFCGMFLSNIINQQYTAVFPAFICPFLVPLEVRAVLASMSKRSVSPLTDGWL
jgi:hypothetical protein